ncbi:DUF433 domain-containing protein [Halobacteriales archaeon QS_4_66_20]|nr:MAG: DUF433 domain-containing protein [Halobacteriales archaeon QS_4_66_20]
MSTTVRIIKTPDVLHGRPRIEGTRVGVFTLGASRREHGESVEDLLEEYPDLDRKEIEAALDYYDDHPELMDYIRTQKRLRKQNVLEQSRAPTAGSEGS